MSWDWEKLKEQQERQSGGGIPPQVNELLEKFKKLKLPGGPLLILILIILFFGSSTFFTVGVDEVGVVQRFGKYVRTAQPGLNFKLPAGIEKITKVKIRRIYKEEFGFRSVRREGGRPSFAGSDTDNVALMLTGDLNVALVPWIVQYRIKDPYNYLFKVQDIRRLLVDLSESTMRLVVGAFLAGYFLSPIFKVGTINDAITIPTMLVTLLGSVILLAIVRLIRRR